MIAILKLTVDFAIFTALIACPILVYSSPVSVPMKPENWDVQAQNPKFEQFKGFDTLFAEGGAATAKGVELEDGKIEFDIFLQDKFSFPGIRFRRLNIAEYEEFYFRPFESGKDDAYQYSPVYNGVNGWQLYTGPGFSGAYTFPLGRWMHVSLLLDGNYAEVYLDNEKTPMLVIPALKRDKRQGGVSLVVDNAYFANFSFTNGKQNITRRTAEPPALAPAANIIKSWMVSDIFRENQIKDAVALDDIFAKQMTWTALKVENNEGLVNIARLRKRDPEQNTVLARFIFEADKDQIKRFSFGYSDRARIFFNDKLIFSGNDGFRTRDFRFLGTVGYYYDLYLPVKKGQNVLTAAVSENFGGWGFMGKFENLEGLRTVEK